MKKFAAIFLSCLLTQIVEATGLNQTEEYLSHYITTQANSQLSLLEELVNLNSGTTNMVGVQKVGEILRHQFEQLGFKTYWIEEPHSMHRAGTLVAKRIGHKGKRLLLIGHLDTVFPSDSSFQHFEHHGSTATGPGVIDDKGGDVVILYALKALNEAHLLDDATITVVLTGDEEDSGKPTSVSRKPLIDAAQHSDIALDFEWSFTPDTATIARRGITNWTVKTQGKEAHSSEIFKHQVGDGAIFELARILNTMRGTLSREPYLSFNPGVILGGNTVNNAENNAQGTASGKTNVIAKTAIVMGDLRFISQQQKSNAEKKIIAIVNQHLPNTTASVIFNDGIPAMPPTEANLQLLKKYSSVSNDLGYGIVKILDPGLRGAGDISHIASIVSACLAGLGPVGVGAHSIKETLDLNSLTMQTQRAALLMYRLIST
ncbi:M20/M25/M40 family metallo-hydrolase [Legionella cardiaca]|uniref:M20/M25/M40 family metallo-hydrolase n=1 Tax=Legionella cardiaca TaxID=1071983 RepID=A0ABY8AUS2_9GAMM|nr:M20/M25/M40 family metallo-hydrolase [Legionella cardiaca]WED44447.1 M20/M25/M40 family metallo-hydrolase [Legionella cardiaca]